MVMPARKRSCRFCCLVWGGPRRKDEGALSERGSERDADADADADVERRSAVGVAQNAKSNIIATHVAHGQQASVEEEHDAERREEEAKGREPEADFWWCLIVAIETGAE